MKIAKWVPRWWWLWITPKSMCWYKMDRYTWDNTRASRKSTGQRYEESWQARYSWDSTRASRKSTGQRYEESWQARYSWDSTRASRKSTGQRHEESWQARYSWDSTRASRKSTGQRYEESWQAGQHTSLRKHPLHLPEETGRVRNGWRPIVPDWV